MRPNTGRARFPNSERTNYLGKNTIGLITGGIEDFLDEHGVRELDVPATYTAMDEFEGYIGTVSASGREFGMGFDAGRLEAGIRVATGGGRYSADALTVIACDDGRAVFRSSDGDFCVAPAEVPRFEAPSAHAYDTYEVAGMEIPESNEGKRDAIATLVDLLSEYEGLEIADHVKVSGRKHYFKTDAGDEIRITAHTLGGLNGIETDRDAFLGTKTWDSRTSPYSFEWDLTADDLDFDVEDEWLNGQIVGFNTRWKTDRHSRYSDGSGLKWVKLCVEFITMHVDDNGKVRHNDTTRCVNKWEV